MYISSNTINVKIRMFVILSCKYCSLDLDEIYQIDNLRSGLTYKILFMPSNCIILWGNDTQIHQGRSSCVGLS